VTVIPGLIAVVLIPKLGAGNPNLDYNNAIRC